MSSNSAQIVNRANASSPFYSAIKQRSSNAGLRGQSFLYSSETNTSAQARSKVRIVSTTNPGESRIMRIPLSRHGLLQKLVLHATWGGGTYTVSGVSNAIEAVPNLGIAAWTEVSLVCEGQKIAKLNPYGEICEIYCNSSNEDLPKYQALLHGYDCGLNAIGGVAADKDGLYNAQHWLTAAAPNDGIVHTYYPVPFWFSKRQNLALDLGILANQVYLEVSVDSYANIFKKTGTATLPVLQELEVIQYISELDHTAERERRAAQYSVGSPLTQISYNTTSSIIGSAILHSADATAFSLRMNMFSGVVKKVIVFATLADNFATNGHRLRPIELNNLKLRASGSEIWEQQDMPNKEPILESLINGTRWTNGENTNVGLVTAGTNKVVFAKHGDVAYTGAAPTTAQATAMLNTVFEEQKSQMRNLGALQNFSFDCGNVYVIDFSSLYDFSKVSANGSSDFAQLNSPELSGTIPSGCKGYNAHNLAHGAAVKVDIHAIAYNETLISYITNSAGSTQIRMIES